MTPRRYAIILGGLVLTAVSGVWYWLFGPRDVPRGPTLEAGQITWIAHEVETRTLWDRQQIDLTLVPVRSRTQQDRARLDAPMLRAICGAALVDLPRLGIEARRDQVFQIRVSVLDWKKKELVAAGVPVNVREGACGLDLRNKRFFPRFPAPLDEWTVERFNVTDRGKVRRIDINFIWAGEGKPVLSEFPFKKACEAVLALPPVPPLAALLDENPVREVAIFARVRRGNSFLGLTYGWGKVFGSVGTVCGEVVEEIET